MSDYKSSVLRCHPEDDGCLVCEFLSGARTEKHLLEVIRILDGNLADEEKHNRHLTQCLVDVALEEPEQVSDAGSIEGAPDGTRQGQGVPTEQEEKQ